MTEKPRPAKARTAPEGLEKNPCFWLGVLDAVGEVNAEMGQECVRLVGYETFLRQFADLLAQCHLHGFELRKREDAARKAAYHSGVLEGEFWEGAMRSRLEINADEDAWHEMTLEGRLAKAVIDFLSLCRPRGACNH